MKIFNLPLFTLLILCACTLTGCDLVGDIFEAGMWMAVIIIVLVIVIIGWIFKKIRGK